MRVFDFIKLPIALMLIFAILSTNVLASKDHAPSGKYKIIGRDFIDDISYKKKPNPIKVFIKLKKGTKFSLNDLPKIKRNKLRLLKRYAGMNLYVVEIQPEEIEALASLDSVEYVEIARPFRLFLNDSVPLINADEVWNFGVSGINITGVNVSVCAIDTGVDYTHPDLGRCTLSNNSVEGIVYDYSLESAHPYDNNVTVNYTIQNSSFNGIGVHFSRISTEPLDDFVRVYDENGTLLAEYTGEYRNVWISANGSAIIISLSTDDSINGYGFSIDQVVNGTAKTEFTWQNCKKVVYGYDFAHDDPDPMDEYPYGANEGHGTHVAGIIGANGSLKGVAPDVNILAAKVFDYWGNTDEGIIVEAIDWCINNSKKYNVVAISMSLGTEDLYSTYCDANYPTLAAFIDKAVAHNISVVVATGNAGSTSGISSPACVYNATRVAATDKYDNIATFSNRASGFEYTFMAPGKDIYSTIPPDGYALMSGTSMATPHISGAIALLAQAYRSLYGFTPAPSFIKELINNTGKLIYDSGTGTYYPRIDVYAAFKYIYPFEFIYPKDRVFYTNHTFIVINVSLNDLFSNIDTVILNLNGTNNTMVKENTGKNITASYNITDLNDGQYSYLVSFNDTAGRTFESMTRELVVDLTAPLVDFSDPTPKNSSAWNLTYVLINLSVYDLNPDQVIFYWNGSKEIYVWQDTSEYLLISETDLSDGNYSFYAIATDKAGNVKSTDVYSFYVMVPPDIFLTSPINTTYGTTEILINLTTRDNTAIDTCWYQYNDTTVTLENCSNTTFFALNNTQSTLTVCANDTHGNVNCTQITFTVDTTPPELIVTYPQNNSRSNTAQVNISFFAVDNLAEYITCNLSVTNETNKVYSSQVMVENHTQKQETLNLQDGCFELIINCFDDALNADTAYALVHIDTNPPNIFLNITNFSYFNFINISLFINVSDIHEFNSTVYIDGVTLAWLDENNSSLQTTLTLNEGIHNISVLSVDGFNNTEKKSVIFGVDLTPPEITRFELLKSEIYVGDVLNQDDFICEAGDNLSGIESKIIMGIDTSTEGEKEARCIVYDKAGNVGVKTLSYYVKSKPISSSGSAVTGFVISSASEENATILENESHTGELIYKIKRPVPEVVIKPEVELMPVYKIKVEFNSPQTGTISILKLKDLPFKDFFFQQKHYVSIDGFDIKVSTSDVRKMEIYFTIQKDIVKEQMLNLSTVKLVRFTNTTTYVYDTTFLEDVGDRYLFKSDVDHLSQFIIVAQTAQETLTKTTEQGIEKESELIEKIVLEIPEKSQEKRRINPSFLSKYIKQISQHSFHILSMVVVFVVVVFSYRKREIFRMKLTSGIISVVNNLKKLIPRKSIEEKREECLRELEYVEAKLEELKKKLEEEDA